MRELYVFDKELNILGEISIYENLKITRNYYKVSMMELVLPSTIDNIKLLQQQNIITMKSNVNFGYIIEHIEYVDESKTSLRIEAYSLNYILSWRVIKNTTKLSGNVENVIKKLIKDNFIITERNRVINNLVLATNTGITNNIETMKTGGEVLSHILELCKENELTVDILINHQTKEFEVLTWQGLDRSVIQNTNDRVAFSKENNNIITQEYILNFINYKNSTYIAGGGTGTDREVASDNDDFSGWDRRELYIDARDLQKEYLEDGEEVVLSDEEYLKLLQERGKQKRTEHQIVELFNVEVDMYSNFKYGVDYNLGDKVSIINKQLNKALHTRVVSVEVESSGDGESLKIEFGSNIPTRDENLLRKVRRNGNL